jgi:hypothetical protein
MGFGIHIKFPNISAFIDNAATTAGHAIGTLPKNEKITGVDWKGIDNVTSSIGRTIQKIPVVGPLLHAVLGISTEPFAISEDILKGDRIDHVAVQEFRRHIGNIREIAPYAQTVISFVPAIGPLASSAIGAGLAISEGLPADEVAMAAVAGAIPGGALAQAAYKVGRSAIVNKRVGGVADLVSAIGTAAGVSIPPAANVALRGGLNALQAMANGTKPDQALVSAAIQAAPGVVKDLDLSTTLGLQNAADALIAKGQAMIPSLSDAQRTQLKNALHTGIAMQHAQNLQGMIASGLSTGKPYSALASIGANLASRDPIVKSARQALSGQGVSGFDVGTGLMQHVASTFQAAIVRDNMSPSNQHGFDVAATLHMGRVLTPPPAASDHPAAQAGHAMTHGLRASDDPSHRVALMNTAARHPQGRQGAAKAASDIEEGNRGFFAAIWHAFRALLGLEDEAKQAFFKEGDALAKESRAPDGGSHLR